MQAAVIHTLGQPPRYQEFAAPSPVSDEVLVRVRAVGLHPIVRALASGSHYLGKAEVPMIAGIDAVGIRADGARVYFGMARRPWGTMAELCSAPARMCFPLPDGIDDLQAAAIVNPGMSAWLSLKERAQLARGETVLILGATGVAGRFALQAARHLGVGRVIGAGRNTDGLAASEADAVISLRQPEDAIREAFAAEAARGIDVVIDFLWGRPTELFLEALAGGFRESPARTTRLVEVGESAGKSIALPGATLRSVDLRLLGSGFGSVSLEKVVGAIPGLFALAATGVFKVDVEPVPMADVEAAWDRVEKGRRIVFTV